MVWVSKELDVGNYWRMEIMWFFRSLLLFWNSGVKLCSYLAFLYHFQTLWEIILKKQVNKWIVMQWKSVEELGWNYSWSESSFLCTIPNQKTSFEIERCSIYSWIFFTSVFSIHANYSPAKTNEWQWFRIPTIWVDVSFVSFREGKSISSPVNINQVSTVVGASFPYSHGWRKSWLRSPVKTTWQWKKTTIWKCISY